RSGRQSPRALAAQPAAYRTPRHDERLVMGAEATRGVAATGVTSRQVEGVRLGYHSVNAYLNVPDAIGMVRFLAETFGAIERGEREVRTDTSVGHTEVQIGDSVVMISQATSDTPARPGVLFVYVADVDAACQRAQAAGCVPIASPRDQPWGDR